MANGLYVAMSGAMARQDKLDSVADNLANTQTAGFKAERGSFQSFLPSGETEGPASPAAIESKLDLHEGPMQTTGQPLDVTPEGGAFLPVQVSETEVGYTRNGRLSVGDGNLLYAAGHPLLDASGSAISVPPGEKVEISKTGSVTVRGASIAQLATYQLSGALNRSSPSVLTLGSDGAAEPASGQLGIGILEGANYTAMEGMVDMITAQRQFDSSMQAIQTYKTMSDASNKVGTVQ